MVLFNCHHEGHEPQQPTLAAVDGDPPLKLREQLDDLRAMVVAIAQKLDVDV